MSAIPLAKAGVGAGINGTSAEFGSGLGVVVLGAVLNSRFGARITQAFSSGLETSQLVGAVAGLLGGSVAAALLRRAERADKEVVVA